MKTKHTPEHIALDLLGAHATADMVKTASAFIRKYQGWEGTYFKLQIAGSDSWMDGIKKMLVAYEGLGAISFAGDRYILMTEIVIACLKREPITIMQTVEHYEIRKQNTVIHLANLPKHLIGWFGFMRDIYRFAYYGKDEKLPVYFNNLAELAEYLEVDYEN